MSSIIVIGSGIGGLTTAALLAQQGYRVTVLEAQTYPGGCASTFTYQGYRFESGATLAGGFQANGPHALVAQRLGIGWPIHRCDPAWVVHLPDRSITLTSDYQDILAQFPESQAFWSEQQHVADLGWAMAADGLPWPPTSPAELVQLARIGLGHFPADMRLARYALGTVRGWLGRHGLANNTAFKRFIDAQLLISAQTTADHANALYGATALDLARQGVQHVEGGIGGLAETLVQAIKAYGGEVLYRRRVSQIKVEAGRVTGVRAMHGRHDTTGTFYPADFVVANVTPWSLDTLLGEDSPPRLRRETHQRQAGWGAFALHLGVKADNLPQGIPDHHQIITEMEGPLGEGRSLFISMSPLWDSSRAPSGHRAVTITTHTAVQPWWDMLSSDEAAYQERKQAYTERMLQAVEGVITGFRDSLELVLPGSPVTYQFYTERHLGMVGGFPQQSLFAARSPRTGLPNLRLVGDSIFPGQSTAGVTLGAMRVARDIQQRLPIEGRQHERSSLHVVSS